MEQLVEGAGDGRAGQVSWHIMTPKS
jgi:hypothetical protein